MEEYVADARRRGVEDSYDLLSTAREGDPAICWPRGKVTVKSPNAECQLVTVETHRENILQKLHLHSLPELILYAVRKGLIS